MCRCLCTRSHTCRHSRTCSHMQTQRCTCAYTRAGTHVRGHTCAGTRMYMCTHMQALVCAHMQALAHTRDPLAPLWVLLAARASSAAMSPRLTGCPGAGRRAPEAEWGGVGLSAGSLGRRALTAPIVIKCSDMRGTDTSLDHMPATSLRPAALPPAAKLRESPPPPPSAP